MRRGSEEGGAGEEEADADAGDDDNGDVESATSFCAPPTAGTCSSARWLFAP